MYKYEKLSIGWNLLLTNFHKAGIKNEDFLLIATSSDKFFFFKNDLKLTYFFLLMMGDGQKWVFGPWKMSILLIMAHYGRYWASMISMLKTGFPGIFGSILQQSPLTKLFCFNRFGPEILHVFMISNLGTFIYNTKKNFPLKKWYFI